jgi:hypothetical protein
MDRPFSTQAIARSPFFTDREREVARVLDTMRTRGRLCLYGERRMGKSSVVARAADQLVATGGVVVQADAWTVQDLDGLTRELLRSVPTTWLAGERLQRLLETLRSVAALSVDESGKPVLQLLSRPTSGPEDPRTRLSRLVRALDSEAKAHPAPVVVVIDEFQRVAELEDGAGGLLRGLVQEAPHLAWLFAGSIVGLVMELLGPKGPFHAIERMEIGPIDREHLVRWLQHRMESHGVRVAPGAAAEVYDRAGPVTEYVVRLAKMAYLRAQGEGTLDHRLVDEAFSELVADYGGSFELIWSKLSGTKRRIMRALADGEEQLTSHDVLRRYEISSSSAASYAITELRRDGLLAPGGAPYRISDPFFAAWVRETP